MGIPTWCGMITGATYMGGFGFHPIYCVADVTGETLGVLLRPRNGELDRGSHHVLDQAISQPEFVLRSEPRNIGSVVGSRSGTSVHAAISRVVTNRCGDRRCARIERAG